MIRDKVAWAGNERSDNSDWMSGYRASSRFKLAVRSAFSTGSALKERLFERCQRS